MSRVIISSFAVVFCTLFSGVAQAEYYWPVPPPKPPIYKQQLVRLEPGDVILSINNRQLFDLEGFMEAVGESGDVMYLTVQDRRTGRHTSLVTRLSKGGHRFGVLVVENGGDGVLIRQVYSNTAAQRCQYSNGIAAGNNSAPQTDVYENPDGSINAIAMARPEPQKKPVQKKPVQNHSSLQIRRHRAAPR